MVFGVREVQSAKSFKTERSPRGVAIRDFDVSQALERSKHMKRLRVAVAGTRSRKRAGRPVSSGSNARLEREVA